ncbi:MAG: HNH endonuclease [Steroidobacteraceae bacterium]|jgi:hypothetical protein|nr:HNH endonuclease [Steroidobacteraceae bacterium]
MPLLGHILLAKIARDAGFDIPAVADSPWLAFDTAGSALRLWLRDDASGPVAALSSRAVLSELDVPVLDVAVLPPAAAGAFQFPTADAMLTALARAQALNQSLPDRPYREFVEQLSELGATERDAIVRQRVGQDRFRDALMQYWGGRCAVTGLAVPELLRASHAKPWKVANDRERLDVHNGLLLAVQLDALFDRGFLWFDSCGDGALSPALGAKDRRMLGLGGFPLRLSRLSPAHEPFLAYHRDHVAIRA